MIDEPKERAAFEETAFAQYFLSTIKRNENVPQPKISGALDYVSENCMNSDEFLAKDEDGNYTIETLNSAWWAWKARAEKIPAMV